MSEARRHVVEAMTRSSLEESVQLLDDQLGARTIASIRPCAYSCTHLTSLCHAVQATARAEREAYKRREAERRVVDLEEETASLRAALDEALSSTRTHQPLQPAEGHSANHGARGGEMGDDTMAAAPEESDDALSASAVLLHTEAGSLLREPRLIDRFQVLTGYESAAPVPRQPAAAATGAAKEGNGMDPRVSILARLQDEMRLSPHSPQMSLTEPHLRAVKAESPIEQRKKELSDELRRLKSRLLPATTRSVNPMGPPPPRRPRVAPQAVNVPQEPPVNVCDPACSPVTSRGAALGTPETQLGPPTQTTCAGTSSRLFFGGASVERMSFSPEQPEFGKFGKRGGISGYSAGGAASTAELTGVHAGIQARDIVKRLTGSASGVAMRSVTALGELQDSQRMLEEKLTMLRQKMESDEI